MRFYSHLKEVVFISVFAIGDLHLSLGCDKPMDIFGPAWENHTDRLRENWNKIVSSGDTVVVPGDISWAMDFEQARAAFHFIESLDGKKILLKGNHDYWWQTNAKNAKFLASEGLSTITLLFNDAVQAEDFIICGTRGWFVDSAYSPEDEKIVEREAGRFRLSFQAAEKLQKQNGGEILAFLHYPLCYGGVVCEKLASVVAESGIRRCWYGHLHGVSQSRLHASCKGVRTELVAADYVQFKPVRIFPQKNT